jgi:hypothetical protein
VAGGCDQRIRKVTGRSQARNNKALRAWGEGGDQGRHGEHFECGSYGELLALIREAQPEKRAQRHSAAKDQSRFPRWESSQCWIRLAQRAPRGFRAALIRV